MRICVLFLICCVSLAKAQQHCGYDFTSYIVLHIHEDGKKPNIENLKVTLIDSTGREVVNVGNKYSWNKKDKILQFSENYKIDAAGNKIPPGIEVEKSKWFFPYAKDTYLLSVTNTFPADEFRVKIVDVSDKPRFETAVVQLYAYNMFVLCSSQVQQQTMQFGPRVNKPVEVVLEKKK